MLPWLESTAVARTIADSSSITGLLSAVHLLGTTLVGGGALVAGLRLLGVLLTDRPVQDIARPAGRGIVAGLGISLATGLLLFSARATTVAASSYFQTKMQLLVAAIVFQTLLFQRAVGRADGARGAGRLAGALCLLLWIGVVAAGCAFILLGE